MIELKMKYFGMIAEKTKISEEVFALERSTTIEKLKSELITKYPVLDTVFFRIAVNQDIFEETHVIDCSCEIALLPAFAGG